MDPTTDVFWVLEMAKVFGNYLGQRLNKEEKGVNNLGK